jgi:hypothetical protein
MPLERAAYLPFSCLFFSLDKQQALAVIGTHELPSLQHRDVLQLSGGWLVT